ncbi:Response regulator of zinc sigma-54-dependent two-component system [hydrothermal vent metagenome]|uniref:Response regulator of zinc sigma-54-dependent two-component system n=1 Tax=hydrothermal vent metagenome TaxID=652676 RepID=A0A3B1BDR6_9ZZZZ
MLSLQIIIVDDELAIRQVLTSNLAKEGYIIENYGDAESAFERLSKGDVDIAICDIRMPGMSGIELMDKTLKSGIDTSFLLMTAHASVDTAIEAMRLGAFDYMTKPVHTEEVLHQIKQICDLRGLRTENKLLRSLVLGDSEDECVLDSEPINEIHRMSDKVADTESTVLITGESGTGKGVIARRIHKLSERSKAPFIPVNCGAIAENLMESEFFGHVKGAFTGADRAKKGLFLEADKGSIFLDEIGELPLHLQVKLLHVLESKEVRAVGSEKVRKIDVRIITATNRDLSSMVAQGEFREDLYFRLNVFHIHIPPLRVRQKDILKLVHFFIRRDADRFAHGKKLNLEADAENALLGYDWPGNVREVENVVARALILADGEYISIDELPAHISSVLSGYEAESVVSSGSSLKEQVKVFEHNLILRTINETGGDRSLAAKKLGIGTSTLYRKLDGY